ncbi:unnamed protein product, partial [Pylaiella littoralis]
GKAPDTLNKTLKAVGSAYDMAGRMGGKFKARAALAAAASKPPDRAASAPAGAVDVAASAAAAAAVAAATAKKPKSPHSWGSGSLTGMQRPGWGRKATGDTSDSKTGGGAGAAAAAGSGGNCLVS